MIRRMKAVHPGTILLEEVIIPNNHSIEQAAGLLGTTVDNLSSVTNGESPISPVLADSISQHFGGSAELWLRLQKAFDSDQK